MKQTNPNIALLLASAALIAGLAGCHRDSSTVTTTSKSQQGTPDPSAVVIGQAPAAPTGDPPGTTPVSGNTTEVTKAEESTQKPAEGDNHSHSTLAPTTPQKADGNNTTSQRSPQ